MPVRSKDDVFTPAQASAVAGLPLRAVQKAIEHRLIRTTRARQGRQIRRLLSRSAIVYLRLEAKGLSALPLSTRRVIAKAIEEDPGIDAMSLSKENVVVIQCKHARRDVDAGLRQLSAARRAVITDPEILGGTPVYRGTRIPVHAVADMLSQGATVEEILEGYPSLDRDNVELATIYAKAFPRKGRPAARPWAKRSRMT